MLHDRLFTVDHLKISGTTSDGIKEKEKEQGVRYMRKGGDRRSELPANEE